jgi:hypothetical protein
LERPLRAQLVVLGVAVLVAVGVPLYLLRKPSGGFDSEAKLAARARNPAPIHASGDAGVKKPLVNLSSVQRVSCGAAANRPGNEGSLCDRLPQIEREFVRSIEQSLDCAPRTGKDGSINYVLNIDFTNRQLSVFPGASGSWKGPQAKAAAKCVERALPEMPWDGTLHRYRFYSLAVLATYPPPDAFEALPSFDEP